MTKNQKFSVDFTGAVTNVAESLDSLVEAYFDYVKTVEQEQTKRAAIGAWEKAKISEIQAKRDFLITYLERSFDERRENFSSLFSLVDRAIESGDNQQLAFTLNSITELAKSSPFDDLQNLSHFQAALADPDHVWEL